MPVGVKFKQTFDDGTVQDVDGVGPSANGTAEGFATRDHTHFHGNLAGGALHDLTDSSQDGFQPQSNRSAAVDPTVNDDAAAGYAVGSYWVNTSSDTVFFCVDSTNGAAVWLMVSGTNFQCAQETLTTENITGTDTALADTLSNTPLDDACVVLDLNGIRQIQGAGQDYTVSGTTITWLASTGTAVDMATTDSVLVTYLF